MTARTFALATAVVAVLTTGAQAQQSTQQPLPIRPLGPITRVTKDSLAAVSTAVQTTGGRVFLNDISAHRVILFDSTLSSYTVVADSAALSANASGGPRAPTPTLLPYHGDSALLITPASLSMLVLSPAGAITRTMAMPSAGNAGLAGFVGNIFGTPGFDSKGRMVYFLPIRLPFVQAQQRAGNAGPQLSIPVQPDSAMIARYDLGLRQADTAGYIRIPKSRTTATPGGEGKPFTIQVTAFPPQTVDDWAVTSDGSIAVVRGRDYHVDWLSPDGKWSSTPRMPYAWEHITDDQKGPLLDSVLNAFQATFDSIAAQLEKQRAAIASGAPVSVNAGGGPDRGAAGGGGGSGVTIITRDGGGGDGGGRGPPGRQPAFQFPKTVVARAELNDVPDYRPPFQQGAVRADMDGNLWIRTSATKDGQPVYDIVNRKGEVTDRVQLPAYRRIAGFGPGVVYMGVRDSLGVAHLERARVK